MPKKQLFYAGIILPGIFILVIIISYLIYSQLTLKSQNKIKKLKGDIIKLYQENIADSQKEGTLVIYNPIIVYDNSNNELSQLNEIFNLLCYKEKIKKLIFQGSYSYFWDASLMIHVSTMPDLESLEIANTCLHGDLFIPLNSASNFHSLSVFDCSADKEVYDSLIQLKNIKQLTILAPVKKTEDNNVETLEQKDIHNIALILCKGTQIEYMLLDKSFIDEKDMLKHNLPNTKIQFGILDKYDGKPIIFTDGESNFQ